MLAVILICFASCTSLKPLHFTSNKQVVSAQPVGDESADTRKEKRRVQFLDNIDVTPESTTAVNTDTKSGKHASKSTVNTRGLSVEDNRPSAGVLGDRSATVEKASTLQLKYAILLNTEVEQLQNLALLESVDKWYGTRYRLGGTTERGIDCSAFVQAVFLGAYSFSLPRTAREQYKASNRISTTELKEGDLVFFNTTGGISHVGIYLQNNKFIHASASKGVTISDMFDPYYLRRFIGAGRVNDKQGLATNRAF